MVQGINKCECFSMEHVEYDLLAAREFGECLFTWNERASFYVGMTSLLFWVLCQLPQFVTNYYNQSADALAPLLLAQWLVADTLNLLGALLTHQLVFQRISAGLFVSMHLIMIGQKVYYSGKKLTTVSSSSRTQPLLFIAMLVMIVCLPQRVDASGKPNIMVELSLIESCESEMEIPRSNMMVGNVLGWIASFFYVGSRLPQILKNRQRRSTDGISKSMFLCAVLGNLTYSSGILLRSSHLERSIPWLLASLACMCLDLVIVSQVWFYDRNPS